MKAKVLSLCIALLVGVSAWADDVWNYNVYDGCSKNGYKGGYVPAPADVQAVDLGLPSGIKWASCNVGAEKPEDYGNYYAWGEVLPKENYSWETYKYANGASNKLTKYCNEASSGDNGFIDNKTTLEPEDDAARVNWDGSWRMPTDAEWTELREQCTWTKTTQNGIIGYLVESKTNSNSIFLPAAGYRYDTLLYGVGNYGYYWSSWLGEDYPSHAWYLQFSSDGVSLYSPYRSRGLSVRPVCPSTSTQSSAEDNFTMLTLYANGCESANVIGCDPGQPINVSAIPENEHRHFVRWTDGNTDNPRLVTVTKDTTFTAEFAYNQYTISTSVNDAERGSVSGGTTTDYLSEVTLTATANYGYHFAHWTDGEGYWGNWNTDNPRTVQVKGDATYSAVFEKNIYTITAQSANGIQGYVSAPSQVEYLDQVSLTANPNVGYHFTQWTDGNTDNPREIVLTCDTTFTAEFAQTFSGQCGDNLYWKYEGHTLTISGTGNMYDYNENDMPWLLFRDTTDVVILERGITGIGNNAFNGFVKLGKIELPNTLTSIGANAFAGCRKLYDIYSYAVEPPVAEKSSFANYNVYLHVPCDNLRDYQMDAVFGSFKYIQCIGAENTTTDGTVTVTPSDNEAVFVWRADESAASYNLEIRKDGEVFCTLIFNANGQLTSIAFAPARNGQTHRAAEQTAAGFRFTVTGLSESTRYTFGMTVKDAANATLQTYTGEFNTTGVATSLDNATTDTGAQKIIRDGQVFILRGDKTYTTMGVEVNL